MVALLLLSFGDFLLLMYCSSSWFGLQFVIVTFLIILAYFLNDISNVKVAEFLSEYFQHLRNGIGSLFLF